MIFFYRPRTETPLASLPPVARYVRARRRVGTLPTIPEEPATDVGTPNKVSVRSLASYSITPRPASPSSCITSSAASFKRFAMSNPFEGIEY